MNIELIQPIRNQPAIFIQDKKILVIADLHIGIEKELREKGLNVNSQTQKMTKNLISLCKKYKPAEIIIIGDVKHNIPSSTYGERRDVKNFLDEVKNYGNIHIVPGNHDGNIDKIAPENVNIRPSDGFIIENVGFVHGHRWPNKDLMRVDQLILAHTHPSIMLTDRLEHRTFELCWIRSKILKEKLNEKYPDANSNQKILIMPPFNPLCGGIAANKDGIMGPIGKIIDIQNSQIYLLDGTLLGKVKDIK